MNILITGSLGYVGTLTVEYLLSKGYCVSGIDSGYFANCNLKPTANISLTKMKDIRDLELEDFTGIEAVIHLAALSNDPVGELDTTLTFDINYHAAVRAAELAKKSKVKKFIFISTQSIYGISKSKNELSEDLSVKNPQTAYAKSKWQAEQEILSMHSNFFTVCALRPSTVFGWGERLRSDIVFNNLITFGIRDNLIKVHSDGTPWRPVLHIQDLARAIELCIKIDSQFINGLAFNVGMLGGNYTIKDLALKASQLIGNLPVKFSTENLTDSRSYRVSFEKAKKILSFEATTSLDTGGQEMVTFLKKIDFEKNNNFFLKTNRLAYLDYLIKENKLDENLRFK